MSTQEPSSSQEASKTLVQRAPEVAGNVLRQILEFAIDGNMTIPGAKDAAARCLQHEDCSGCISWHYRANCVHENRCMKAISVEEAWQAVEQVLGPEVQGKDAE